MRALGLSLTLLELLRCSNFPLFTPSKLSLQSSLQRARGQGHFLFGSSACLTFLPRHSILHLTTLPSAYVIDSLYHGASYSIRQPSQRFFALLGQPKPRHRTIANLKSTTMVHEKSSQYRKGTRQEESLKRPIEPSAQQSLPKRVGEIFIKTHNREGVCAKIDRLAKWRDSIIDDRNLLELPTSRKVLKTAQSLGGKEETYLANERVSSTTLLNGLSISRRSSNHSSRRPSSEPPISSMPK